MINNGGKQQSTEPLTERDGLPDDLVWLYKRYPREVWQDHGNLGGMARFWLKRHDMFREIGPMIRRGIEQYREDPANPKSLAAWLGPRINFFLGELDAHHNIEDYHYFPLFKDTEPKLARGFELLDSDHHIIHSALESNAQVAGEFFRHLQTGGDKARSGADAYAAENEKLISLLTRHLSDEEDLIIPMILDRGEPEFTMG